MNTDAFKLPMKAVDITICVIACENMRAVRDIDFAPGVPASIKKAARSKLHGELSTTERETLADIRRNWHGVLTTCWSRTLLYGDVGKYKSVAYRAALVKLVRRGLVVLSQVSTPNGLAHLWETPTVQ